MTVTHNSSTTSPIVIPLDDDDCDLDESLPILEDL